MRQRDPLRAFQLMNPHGATVHLAECEICRALVLADARNHHLQVAHGRKIRTEDGSSE